MVLLTIFGIFILILFCINFAIASIILHLKKPKSIKEDWEKSIEMEIEKVLKN